MFSLKAVLGVSEKLTPLKNLTDNELSSPFAAN